MARYLCAVLEGDARYEGFDTSEPLVQWCQANITPLFPNFHFTYSPLSDPIYNPDPTLLSAVEFEFPYAEESFDFVFAHSVFTHLFPDVATHYLREIGRVLRPQGISYTTWVLFDDDPSGYSNPRSKNMDRDPAGTFAVRPPGNIGYHQEYVRDAHRSSGLDILEPVHFGFRYFQDAVVAVK